MKKICLFLLLSCLAAATHAASTSAIASVTVTDLNHSDSSHYEIFAFTNTQGGAPTTTTSFRFVTTGTYTTSDIITFSLYRNTSHSMDSATYIGSVAATAAGVQTISYPALTMPDSTTLYYMIYATVSPNATPGHTIVVSEISNTADTPFAFTGESPIYIASRAAGFKPMRLSDLGQLTFDPANPFNSFSLGAGIGFTTIYGDLEKSNHKPVVMVDLERHLTTDIIVGVELQHGSISSRTSANSWTTGLSETNQFTAININSRVCLSQFIYNPKNAVTRALSKFYIGTGLGVIDNDLTNITRKFKDSDLKTIDPDIKTSSVALVLPVNMGINIDLKKILDFRGAQLNINYSLTYSFNDYVDGYSFSKSTTRNQYNDVYSMLSVGFSFYLGQIIDK